MIGAALQAAVAFNMICTGMLRTGPIGMALPEETGEPFTVEYRIDLDARRWCADDCADSEALASVTDGVIVLRERYDEDGSSVIMLHPRSGRFSDTLIEGNNATLRSGICAPAEFSGFPGIAT